MQKLIITTGCYAENQKGSSSAYVKDRTLSDDRDSRGVAQKLEYFIIIFRELFLVLKSFLYYAYFTDK